MTKATAQNAKRISSKQSPHRLLKGMEAKSERQLNMHPACTPAMQLQLEGLLAQEIRSYTQSLV